MKILKILRINRNKNSTIHKFKYTQMQLFLGWLRNGIRFVKNEEPRLFKDRYFSISIDPCL